LVPDLLDELKENDESLGIDDAYINNLLGKVFEVRNELEVLYSIHEKPVPLLYRQLTNMSIRSYMVILIVHAILHEHTSDASLGYLTRGSFWFILVFAFEYFLFVGWLTVADALGNPFQRWADQFDWNLFIREIDLDKLSISKSGFISSSNYKADSSVGDQ